MTILLPIQDMLFVRTCRMVDLDNATRALEKAKPKNKEQVSYMLLQLLLNTTDAFPKERYPFKE